MLGGLAALAVAAGVVGFVLLQLLRGLQHRLHGHWRLGLAALTRRRMLAVMQLVGLSLSLCAVAAGGDRPRPAAAVARTPARGYAELLPDQYPARTA